MQTPPMPALPDDVRALVAALPTARAPDKLWRNIAARIRNGDVVLLPLDDPHPSRIRSRRLVAAALVIILASGAAAAIGIDALRKWRNERAATDDRTVHTMVPTVSADAPGTIAPVALLIDPDVSGRIHVELIRPAADVRLRVVLSDVRVMQVSATGPAAMAQFRSGRGRIVIADAAGGEVLLEVPRESEAIEVTVDGRVLFSKRGASIRLTVPADTSGAEFILPVR